jgi:hypothetical protein
MELTYHIELIRSRRCTRNPLLAILVSVIEVLDMVCDLLGGGLWRNIIPILSITTTFMPRTPRTISRTDHDAIIFDIGCDPRTLTYFTGTISTILTKSRFAGSIAPITTLVFEFSWMYKYIRKSPTIGIILDPTSGQGLTYGMYMIRPI